MHFDCWSASAVIAEGADHVGTRLPAARGAQALDRRSCAKMDEETALQKARKMKAEALASLPGEMYHANHKLRLSAIQ